MKGISHPFSILFFLVLLVGPSVTYAGIDTNLGSAGNLGACQGSSKGNTSDNKCRFPLGESIEFSISQPGYCVFTQHYSVSLNGTNIINGNTSSTLNNAISTTHVASEGKETATIESRKSKEHGYIYTIHPKKPGKYTLVFNTKLAKNIPGNCEGNEFTHTFFVNEPDPAEFTQAVTPPHVSQSKDGKYTVPYEETGVFSITPGATKGGDKLDKIKNCWLEASDGKYKAGALSDMKDGILTINPLYLQPGKNGSADADITITTHCNMTLEEAPDVQKRSPSAPSIVIRRQTAEEEWGNGPHLVVTTNGGKEHTSGTVPAQWQDLQSYIISVDKSHPTNINKKLFEIASCPSYTIDSSELVNSSAKEGEYHSYGGSKTIDDLRCSVTRTPYDAYPAKSLPVQGSVTLRRYSPRIATQNNFDNSGFVSFSPDIQKEKLRPGGTLTVNTRAHLTGDIPNATVRINSANTFLTSKTCPTGWISEDNGCHLALSQSQDVTGNWLLTADAGLMSKKEVRLTLQAGNSEGPALSGGHIPFSSFTMNDIPVTIMPQIILQDMLAEPAEVKSPDRLQDKVYHYGRQFTLPLVYTLKGMREDSPSEPNTEYQGKLDSLNITLNDGLALYTASGVGALKTSQGSVQASSTWNGTTEKNILSASAPLKAGEQVSFALPLKVVRSSADNKIISVPVNALGSYTPDNVELDDKQPERKGGDLTILLGPDLYPANQAFQLNINSKETLAVLPRAGAETSLDILFSTPLSAEKLATPAGIQNTEMRVTLPAGLLRSSSKDIVLQCGDSACLDNNVVNGAWTGEGEKNSILGPYFLLKPGKTYHLHIPVVVSSTPPETFSPVSVTLSQATGVAEDTEARIVVFAGEGASLTMNKKVSKISGVAVLPLAGSYALQRLTEDDKGMFVTLRVKDAPQNAAVKLKTEKGTSYDMKRGSQDGDYMLFTSEQSLPLPDGDDYTLTALVDDAEFPVLSGAPSRQLLCGVKRQRMSCHLQWGPVDIPYLASKKLLSYDHLVDEHMKSDGTRPVDELKGKLKNAWSRLTADGGWNSNHLFQHQESSTGQTPPPVPAPLVKAPALDTSLFEEGKVMPEDGRFSFHD